MAASTTREAVRAADEAMATTIWWRRVTRRYGLYAIVGCAVLFALGYLQVRHENYSVSEEIVAESFARLGLPRSASPSEIKRAYRKLAAKVHPDHDRSAEAARRFIELSTAYKNIAVDDGDLIDPAYDSPMGTARLRRDENPQPLRASPSESFPGQTVGGTAMLLTFLIVCLCRKRRAGPATRESDGAPRADPADNDADEHQAASGSDAGSGSGDADKDD